MEDKYTRSNIGTFYGNVEMPGGYNHNHVATLKRIDLYYNGKFESGDFDEKGNKKFFYNISKPACEVANKFTDVDTKDVLLYPTVSGNEWSVWLMQHDLKQWLKEHNFGVIFNEVNEDYPKYGHVFIKKTKNGWKKVNISNLRFDPSSQSLETDTWIYEPLLMTAREIMDMGWNKKLVDELLKDKKAKYLIYECYDYNTESTGKKWKRTFKSGVWDYKKGDRLVRGTEALINSENDWVPATILHEDETNELPYRELKWENVPGRRLGMGFVEYLFDNQIAENEAENMERKALFFKALQVWYTRDENIGGRNVFEDIDNGDFLATGTEIATLPKDNSDLSAYNNTRNRWAQNTTSKTFTSDISKGENLPSRTPLGVANIQASMLISYFEKKKENAGLFWKKIFLEDIIPSFKKDSRERHTLTLLSTADGVSKFIRLKAKQLTNSTILKYILKFGTLPTQDMVGLWEEATTKSIKSNKNVGIDIPSDYYDNAKYVFDINITGEQLDTQTIQTSLMTAMQLVASNPAILQNRGTRTMLFKSLQYAGVSPVDLELMEEEIESSPMSQEEMMQGGSIAAQNKSTQSPTMRETTKTI
jgi:hypothetical protein